MSDHKQLIERLRFRPAEWSLATKEAANLIEEQAAVLEGLKAWLDKEISELKAMADDPFSKDATVIHSRAQQHAYQAVKERIEAALQHAQEQVGEEGNRPTPG